MKHDRQQGDNHDETAVDPDVLKPTCEGFGPPPEIAETDQEAEVN
jgi:hypothetical protein